MLKVVWRMEDLDYDQLAAIYEFGSRNEDLQFYSYLVDVFFEEPSARYCILEEQGSYVSVLRLEPYRDGLILTGLQTHKAQRCRGYATKLVSLVLAQLQGVKLYSHIEHSDLASIAVHVCGGFRRISDTAVFLDGSASSRAGTYLYET